MLYFSLLLFFISFFVSLILNLFFIKVIKNKEFFDLMVKAIKGLKSEDKTLLEEAKKTFAEADISLFYNKESKKIRVLKLDCPAIDFPISDFEV